MEIERARKVRGRTLTNEIHLLLTLALQVLEHESRRTGRKVDAQELVNHLQFEGSAEAVG